MNRSEWSPELVRDLVSRGYRVIAADNRDWGFTTISHTESNNVPPDGPSYGLPDLADDLIDFLNCLGVGQAHVVGLSMGGMIAQHIALRAPSLVASLTSIMSTTGRRGVGRPHDEIKWVFTTPPPTSTEEEFVAFMVEHHLAISGGLLTDVDRAIHSARVTWQKGIFSDGTTRQLAAIRADGDRTELLTSITVPTLVIHGEQDPMIDISGGRATADAIHGARFVLIPRLGHFVHWSIVGGLVDELIVHFERGNENCLAL
jgi:pimeloyl-ACP methyl ester carboxylesterase